LLLWIFDKLETFLRISLVVFPKKTETKIVIYAYLINIWIQVSK
jgi:hypothetical protein